MTQCTHMRLDKETGDSKQCLKTAFTGHLCPTHDPKRQAARKKIEAKEDAQKNQQKLKRKVDAAILLLIENGYHVEKLEQFHQK